MNYRLLWLVLVLVGQFAFGQGNLRIVPKGALPAGTPVNTGTGQGGDAGSVQSDAPSTQAAAGSILRDARTMQGAAGIGTAGSSSGQDLRRRNLVSNPGFEEENICTEYNQNCAPEAWIATSLYANYYFDELGQARGGRHFIGLTAGSIRKPAARNFVRTRLLCGMRKGQTYRLEFFLRSAHPVLDSIGIFFSPDDFLYEKRSFREIVPQLWSADAEADDPDRNGWIRCIIDYQATGDEGYITFGHFRRNDIRGVQKGDYNTDYYFFLDEVSVTPLDDREMLCAAADSVRANVYEENERHDYLNRKMYMMRKRSPVNQPLPPTIITTPEPEQVIDTLIIPDIFFASGKYELLASSHKLLDSFVNQLKPGQIDSIVVTGHTDSIGKFEYNQRLSENRASAVANYMIRKQPLIEALTDSKGYAFLQPVSTNTTAIGRSRNRRVEVFVYRR